jgi:hypothetical protein
METIHHNQADTNKQSAIRLLLASCDFLKAAMAFGSLYGTQP